MQLCNVYLSDLRIVLLYTHEVISKIDKKEINESGLFNWMLNSYVKNVQVAWSMVQL